MSNSLRSERAHGERVNNSTREHSIRTISSISPGRSSAKGAMESSETLAPYKSIAAKSDLYRLSVTNIEEELEELECLNSMWRTETFLKQKAKGTGSNYSWQSSQHLLNNHLIISQKYIEKAKCPV